MLSNKSNYKLGMFIVIPTPGGDGVTTFPLKPCSHYTCNAHSKRIQSGYEHSHLIRISVDAHSNSFQRNHRTRWFRCASTCDSILQVEEHVIKNGFIPTWCHIIDNRRTFIKRWLVRDGARRRPRH